VSDGVFNLLERPELLSKEEPPVRLLKQRDPGSVKVNIHAYNYTKSKEKVVY
jgi:hypothetical protein